MTSEYLAFHENMPRERGKSTKVWDVVSKRHGDLLGRVQWFGRWRQYVFVPQPETLFNSGCLDDLREFIGEQMLDRSIRRNRAERERLHRSA